MKARAEIIRCASGAFAPHPNREDTSRTLRLLELQKGGGFGGHVPRAGAGGSPFAQRHLSPTRLSVALAVVTLLTTCAPALAAGSGMPWEAPLQRILESIEGPVAKVSAVVIIIITGLSLAFGDMSGGFRRLIQIVFGLSIAFAATSFFLSFFSFAGGALIN